MKRSLLIFLLVLLTGTTIVGQEKLRNIEKEIVPTVLFQFTYAAQLPGMDTKSMYGFTNTVGGSVIYKTDNNWLLTANGNFIFGDRLKWDRIDILGEGITTTDGDVIGGGGLPASLAFFQRGLHFQAEVGKLFPFKPNPNSGFFVQFGAGYLRNRIRIDYQIEAQNDPFELTDDYQYGYDQMRGGPAFHAETGYFLMSSSKLYNVTISLEATYARTRHLRDYDFRVFFDESGEPYIVGYNDKNARFNDFYYGIRISWMFPTYQRKPDQYYYN